MSLSPCGLFSRCGVQTSHGGGFSCCGTRAPGHAGFSSCSSRGTRTQAHSLWCMGLADPRHVVIFPDRGSNPCLLHWQADSLPLSHQGSPFGDLFTKTFLEVEQSSCALLKINCKLPKHLQEGCFHLQSPQYCQRKLAVSVKISSLRPPNLKGPETWLVVLIVNFLP